MQWEQTSRGALQAYQRLGNRRYIRPNHRTDLPRRLVFFDTEAWREDKGDYEEQRFRLGVLLFITLDDQLNVTSHRWVVARDTATLWWEISRFAMQYDSVVVFAHNANYDVQLSNALVELEKLGWRIGKVYDDQGNCLITWRRGHRKIELVDSFFLLRGSIAELGELLGLPKLSMPVDGDDDDTWATYCGRDVLILAGSIYNWLKFIRDNDLGSFRPTLAGQALAAFRHRFMNDRIFATRDDDVLQLELQAYRGGRCEAFYIGELNGEELYIVDVNSMYPYVMANFSHPTSPLWVLNRPSIARLRSWSRTFWLLVDAYLETDEPVYGIRQHGKLIFPTGRFRAVICGEEVRYALAHGHIKKVEKAVVYRSSRPFISYVNYFYELRLKARREGNVILERNCKLMLNGLYGKFGQRGRKDVVVGEGQDFGYGYETTFDMDTGRRGILKRLGNVAIESYQDGVAWYAFPALAASITAAARVYLWSLIRRAGRTHVYYCDTDSLVVDRVGFMRLRPLLDDDKLGLLKVKGPYSYMRINTAKDYQIGGEVKAKGVGKVVEKLGDGSYVVERWERLRGALRHGIVGMVRVFKRPWRRITFYDKGVVDETGRVRPIRLKEF